MELKDIQKKENKRKTAMVTLSEEDKLFVKTNNINMSQLVRVALKELKEKA